jgi:hypothetical protein
VNKIKQEVELLQSLKICGEAFNKKCPLFLFENIPASDFMTYYYSIKSIILDSPFSYSLSLNNQMKAAFVCIPCLKAPKHEVPKSMVDYDEYFNRKFEENKSFMNEEKCLYGLFLGSMIPGAGKILYSRTFEDMKKEGFTQMYWEMSNPWNTHILNKLGRELNGLKIDLIHQDFYKKKIKVDFFLTNLD